MIKNIIFDLGDIFINVDEKITDTELKKNGLDKYSNGMLEMNEKFEKGLISVEEFKKFYKKLFNDKTDDELIKLWNSILIDFPIHRLSFLENIPDKYNLFLLSNTNELHVEYFKEQMGYDFYCRFKNCFDKVYYSYEINLRKPEPEIFQYILKENNLNKEETLFVDDKAENTDVAKKLGIHVWNLDPANEEVVELFEKINLF
ncbi:MAG: HAD family phosphatase [Bacteroidota bacterium]